jgi:hypothetical protein
MEATDLFTEIRRSTGRLKTLGRRSEASWFAQMPRAQAREGTSGGESRRDGSEVTCSEGGSEALEPRPWNQGGQGSSVWESLELSTSHSSEFEAVEHQG